MIKMLNCYKYMDNSFDKQFFSVGTIALSLNFSVLLSLWFLLQSVKGRLSGANC